jgi:hypothetical protein
MLGAPYTGSNQPLDPQAFGIGRESFIPERTPKSGFITSELLPMSMGSVTGKASLISALHRARRLARMDMVQQLEQWVLQHVPKSEKAHFHMEDAVLQQLKWQSTDELIKVGAPGVPYAAYVNDMNPPVNWTKAVPAKNQYHWFTNMQRQAEQILIPTLARAITALGLASGKAATAAARAMTRG